MEGEKRNAGKDKKKRNKKFPYRRKGGKWWRINLKKMFSKNKEDEK